MKPVHLYITATLVAGAVLFGTFGKDYLQEVYPGDDTFAGRAFSDCERKEHDFSRWNAEKRNTCMAFARLKAAGY